MAKVEERPGRKQLSNGRQLTGDVRDAIVAGEFAPRQRLVEADLMERFGASRGAVRSALATLAVEGLVERIPNRGARVRAIDLEEALEIVELRAAIEALCAARAAERIDPQGVEELRALGAEMERHVADGDPEAYSGGNSRLHAAILRISGARVAPGIVSRLRAQNVRFGIRLSVRPSRPRVSLPEHLRIIEAICAGDPQEASEAMRDHLVSVGRATREYFEGREQSGPTLA